MFVYSMRAGTVRFFGVVCMALLLLVTLVAFVPEMQPVAAATEGTEESISFEGIRTEEDRVAFLKSFGWEVESPAAESATVTVPTEFDKVFAAYNEMQRTQGLDLQKYAGRVAERYTYTVKNYPNYEQTVYANLLIYRGRVIGADICSASADDFLHGLQKPQ